MSKTQLHKNQKNEGKNCKKNSKNFQAKNHSNFDKNSRTMEWLKIPPKIQKEFRDNLIAIEVDFMQYTCYQIKTPLERIRDTLGFCGEIDSDNSNVEYNFNQNLALTRNYTAMGHAYTITFFSPGFPPLPILSVESYNEDKVKLLKTEGKIVFYGAYFVFREILADEAPEVLKFHNAIELGTKFNFTSEQENTKPIYKRTRVDIATDVAVAITKKWLTSYIRPHKTSKHVPRPYNYDPVTENFQSIGYIPRLTRGIGIRVYNKILDIQAKNKQSWHPTYGTEVHPLVTRMEIIYAGDSAQDRIENLIQYTKFRLLGDEQVKLMRHLKPKSQYSAISAYTYFKKYAKNHGKTIFELLNDVTNIAIIEEERKDQYKEIEIFEINSGSSFSSYQFSNSNK